MLCEFGSEPISFPNHDFYFRLLTSSPLRIRAQRNAKKLTAWIHLIVDEPLALHIEHNQLSVGLTLLSFHFQILCRFADSALQIRGKGHVKAAIEQWLLMHQVDENEYGADTAYKLWQRHSWKIEEKNSVFFGQSRGKSARIMSKKSMFCANPPKVFNPLILRLQEIEVELAASRFVAAMVTCFRRPPKKIGIHARMYYYMEFAGFSCRDIAARFGVAKSTANYAHQSIERRARNNRTFSKLLQEALPCALPQRM